MVRLTFIGEFHDLLTAPLRVARRACLSTMSDPNPGNFIGRYAFWESKLVDAETSIR